MLTAELEKCLEAVMLLFVLKEGKVRRERGVDEAESRDADLDRVLLAEERTAARKADEDEAATSSDAGGVDVEVDADRDAAAVV